MDSKEIRRAIEELPKAIRETVVELLNESGEADELANDALELSGAQFSNLIEEAELRTEGWWEREP